MQNEEALAPTTELSLIVAETARLQKDAQALVEAARQVLGNAQSSADLRNEIGRVQTHLDERLDTEFSRIDARLTKAVSTAILRGRDRPIPDLDILDPLANTHVFEAVMLAGGHPSHHRRHLVMPIHPPKIVHLSSVFGQLRGLEHVQDILWTLVTTSAAERETLEEYIAVMKPFIPVDFEIISAIELCEMLNFTDLAVSIAANADGAVINMKKLLAIYRAINIGAEEVCCLDSDVIFLGNPAALFNRAQINYKKHIFIAANCPNDLTREIVDRSAAYMLPEDTALIRSIMGENRFSWFFDIPYYPYADCREFFAYIQYRHGGLERALKGLSWHTFDHILFINFLMQRGDFRMIDASTLVCPGSISDELSLDEIRKIAERHDYTPVWAPLFAILDSTDKGAPEAFIVAFHVDRIKPAI